MSARANLIFVILVGGGVLFFALKFGFIGGAGVGAYRNKSPFNYWLGVAITAAGVVIAAIILVLTTIGVMRP
jgi:hypothetical protein